MITFLFILSGVASLAFLWALMWGKYGNKDIQPPLEDHEFFWHKEQNDNAW